MRAMPFVLALAVGSALPAWALAHDLPVRLPGESGFGRGPAYRGDVFELCLTRTAARISKSRTTGMAGANALGVTGVDRLAAAMGGVWFEPEFHGEKTPAEGSPEPDFTAYYLAHLPPGAALEEALGRFRQLSEVSRADPIAVLPVESTAPNDSLWTDSWWFYQPASIHASRAWDLTKGDTSVVVAVLDTGVLSYHPDIGGSVAGLSGQIWTNWAEAAGQPGVDDDFNGFVDDLHGWDFVEGVSPDVNLGEDGVTPDNDPSDFAGHGTAVAGLVGALTDNRIGVAGTAWNVRIMPVRMGWSFRGAQPGEGAVDMSFAADAIRYATHMGAKVINCSWESDFLGSLDAAITEAVRAGVTIVNAAGNHSDHHYLGDREDVVAVAASDPADRIAGFSNVGPWVDVAAPGVGLSSTWLLANQPATGDRLPAYRDGLDGTSFSAPLVSGVAALIQARSLLPYADHPLTPRGVQLRLMESADDISVQNPTLAGEYGAGRVNAYRALTETSGSTATRVGAHGVGASVLVPTTAEARVAFLADNQRLIQIKPATLDTVMNRGSIGDPVGDLAAADLGGGLGPALFFATLESGVSGVMANGARLDGTWPRPGGTPPVMSGPALGDLDGDGTIEVVSGGDDGTLYAWHADGSDVPGFPITTGASPLNAPPALSDLDGVAGAEVIVAAADGTVHVYRAPGAELANWPVTVEPAPRAPVVMRLGSSPSPTVVVAAGNRLHALAPDGSERKGFPVTLAGSVAQDPAVADLDGDGYDDIVIATVSPATIEARDSLGLALSALGWPRALSGPAQGPPVLGELSTASAGPELLVTAADTLLAFSHDGQRLPSFPKPGRAGLSPSLGQADADAAAEVLAGIGPDALYYIYDAGPSSAGDGAMPWPTARGNDARTGSRLYQPAIGSLDGIPGQVTDLHVTAITASSVTLAWTATGDDGSMGRPRTYDVRAALGPMDEAGFAGAPLRRLVAASVPPGGSQSFEFGGLADATPYWFAVKAVDGAGFSSPLSSTVEATTDLGGPLAGRPGFAVAPLEQPSRGSAVLYWRGSPGGIGGPQSIQIFDLTGRCLRVIDVGPGSRGRVTWDGRDHEGHTVPAGLYYLRLSSGSAHARSRLVLLR